jgi:hypothetical protein
MANATIQAVLSIRNLRQCYLTGQITCVFLVGFQEENTVNEPADFHFEYTIDNSCWGAGRPAPQFVAEDADR